MIDKKLHYQQYESEEGKENNPKSVNTDSGIYLPMAWIISFFIAVILSLLLFGMPPICNY